MDTEQAKGNQKRYHTWHEALYVKDPSRIFLSAVMDDLRELQANLSGHVRYRDFAVSLNDKAEDIVVKYNNTIRHVYSETRSIADSRIGRRVALLTSFRDIQGEIRQEHMSLRLEHLDEHEALDQVWRCHFRFDPLEKNQALRISHIPDMVTQVVNAMNYFLSTGRMPQMLVMLPGFQRLI